jgi:hypothetical protein
MPREIYLVRVGPPVGHREPPTSVVHVVGMEFVRKSDLVAPDGRFVARHSRGIASLLGNWDREEKGKRRMVSVAKSILAPAVSRGRGQFLALRKRTIINPRMLR